MLLVWITFSLNRNTFENLSSGIGAMKKVKAKAIPFDFVIDQLFSIDPFVRPMFGCHAIYKDQKMLLILRNKEDLTHDNGVWVATTLEHLESLTKEFPSLRPVRLLGEKVTAWHNVPADSEDFEEVVLKICDLIRKGDQRIGKIPKPRKKKSIPKPEKKTSASKPGKKAATPKPGKKKSIPKPRKKSKK